MFKPQFKTKSKSKNNKEGVFVLEPLEQGFGHTLGNALRRCLLNSIKGRALTSVKIAGVKHQFSTLSGLKEDIVEFILNLKQVVVKSNDDEPVVLKLKAKGPADVKAKDIKAPANVQIINKDQVIAKLSDSKSKLDCELHYEVGSGFSLAGERKSTTVGLIPTDAAYNPVVQVNYDIEAARVGRRTDYDRLIIRINTNGSVDPEEALMQAAQILDSYFKQVYDPVFEDKKEETTIEIEENAETLDLTVEELDLPTRIANALRKGGYPTVRDLVKANYEEVVKVKDLGSKSVKIIQDKLKVKEIEVFQGK